ncbi:flippase [Aromatoleum anaerobium]|uniref:Oligosaccharide flippase family protein n=1 Tax=Aromatoleum anaerobium TaxID=182180 RepID=A0ABX1PMF5_9RHOO|nr:flippase [Aromatoleum anaerobium]MCK0505738.1 flippase [Aromatoleum anaerobium]
MSKPPFWLRCLPAVLRTKIEHRPNLLKILGNTGWLFFDKVLRMGMGLFVGVWVARYLGPEQFGLFNYATAIVALFTAVATLGLNNIVVRDLVKNPEDASATLGTAFLLQLIGGWLAFISAVIAVTFMRPDDTTARVIVAIFGFAMVFKATDVVRYWFESKVQSKYIVWVENAAFLVFAAIKVALILGAAPLVAFVWIVLAEAALVALLLLAIYVHLGNKLGAWRYQYARAKSLLRDSWPLILSGLAAMLYMRIDQVMLGQMLGNQAVGVYSAAARISEIWYFVPVAIVSSIFPGIVKLKAQNNDLYLSRLQKLYDSLIAISVFVALATTASSHLIVGLLYGAHYSDAATILSIQIWAGIFVTMGISRGPWIITEGLQKYTYRYIGLAMLVNIVCNSFLIPAFGAVGAAVSSIAAQATTALLAPALFAPTRVSVIMLLRSANPIRWFVVLRELLLARSSI